MSAGYGAATTGLGLSAGLGQAGTVTSSSKMSAGGAGQGSGQGGKMVAGMPPGVAGLLPAQYAMIGANTPGFPAYLAAGLGQAPAAMYGYGGHQLEEMAPLQRSTLAASGSLPQLVGSAAATGPPQQPATKGVSSGYTSWHE